MSDSSSCVYPVVETFWVDTMTGEKVEIKEVTKSTCEIEGSEVTEVGYISDDFSDFGLCVMDLESFINCYSRMSTDEK